jgi:enoyl-CoA hydratase
MEKIPERINNITIGQKFEVERYFTSSDVESFATVSKDFNPIHLEETFAQKSIFKRKIVHGLLVASTFSKIIGCDFPGNGSIYLSQSLSFKLPVFLDENIKFIVEVTKVREDKPIITLKTIAIKDDGLVCIDGEAVVKYDKSNRR